MQAEAHLETKLVYEMLDDPAIDFTLSYLDGQQVSLAACKGKVVVLDFWGLWCGRCRTALRGMQQWVHQFAGDSNVVFFFIDGHEGMPPDEVHQKLSAFMSENQYSFRVLMDRPLDEQYDEYEVAQKYGVHAAPLKIVIDPCGCIRFRPPGYAGSTPGEIGGAPSWPTWLGDNGPCNRISRAVS